MSDTRQNLQMKLDFRTEDKGEAPKPGTEAIRIPQGGQ